MRFLAWFATAIRKYKLKFSLLIAGTVIAVAFEYFAAASYKYVVDKAIVPKDAVFLSELIAVIIVFGVVNVLVGLASDYLEALTLHRLVAELRARLFGHLQLMPPTFFARYESGELVNRFTTHISNVSGAASGFLQSIVHSGLGIIVGLTLLFQIEWRLTLLCLVGFSFYFLPVRLYNDEANLYNRKYFDELEQLSNFVEENVNGYRTIYSFNLFASMRKQMRLTLERMMLIGVKRNFTNAKLSRLSLLAMQFASVSILGVGGYFTLNGEMTMGDFVAFYTIFLPVVNAVFTLSTHVPNIITANISLERIDVILQEKPALPLDAPTRYTNRFEREITIDNVSFHYHETRPILRDVSLTIAAGTHVALVGTSGAGKSTLGQLLLRMILPTAGSIAYDGQTLNEAEFNSFMKQYGIVLQETTLFNMSIRDNLLLANDRATEAQMIDACRLAAIHETIMSFEDGYETILVNGGRNLSGGQRQRLALARAFIRQPRILYLDEAFSALDPHTEADISEALLQWQRDEQATILHITHRLASAAAADRILVFHDGRIVQDGTHDQLLASDGPYRKLWRKQHGFVLAADGVTFQITRERLAEVPCFAHLTAERLTRLLALFTPETVQAGQRLFKVGDEPDKFYIIVRGRVELASSQLTIVEDGDEFGNEALRDDGQYGATATALDDCLLLSLTRNHFRMVE